MAGDLPDEQTLSSSYSGKEHETFTHENVLSSSWDVVSEVVTWSLKFSLKFHG
jgi:hypothetical protein